MSCNSGAVKDACSQQATPGCQPDLHFVIPVFKTCWAVASKTN